MDAQQWENLGFFVLIILALLALNGWRLIEKEDKHKDKQHQRIVLNQWIYEPSEQPKVCHGDVPECVPGTETWLAAQDRLHGKTTPPGMSIKRRVNYSLQEEDPDFHERWLTRQDIPQDNSRYDQPQAGYPDH